jgi:hypothetical protein
VKFFFGLMAFLAATVVVILLVVNLFRGLDADKAKNPTTSSYSLKEAAAADTVARYTVSGPTVADEDYEQLRITISRNARTVEVLKGYDLKVEKTTTVPNTKEAYTAFLGALQAAQYSNKKAVITGDKLTTCVTGNKYSYELTLEAAKKVDTWTTSCARSHGNFAGNVDATAQLFRAQIPKYGEATKGIKLSTL